jgi:hypothetical protein
LIWFWSTTRYVWCMMCWYMFNLYCVFYLDVLFSIGYIFMLVLLVWC